MAHMIGKELEPFSVMGYHQGEFKPFTEKDLLGHWSVVFFYPADFTFVCPTELKDLAEQYESFKAEGCEIYSVSEDTHFVHKAWADASDTIKAINYPMLGDPAGVLARQFGVLVEEDGQAHLKAMLDELEITQYARDRAAFLCGFHLALELAGL